jgi:hypothetical protein
MEAICSSETSVAAQQTTRRHIPEDDTLHIKRRPHQHLQILIVVFIDLLNVELITRENIFFV